MDEAVHAAYGWPYPLGDEAILERLIALNLRRFEQQARQSNSGGGALPGGHGRQG